MCAVATARVDPADALDALPAATKVARQRGTRMTETAGGPDAGAHGRADAG